MEVGTAMELSLQPGDVVQCVDNARRPWWTIGDEYRVGQDGCIEDDDGDRRSANGGGILATFRIIRRANYQPKTWGEMTDAEKGALLLAEYRGDCVQYGYSAERFDQEKPKDGKWFSEYYYRIKPQPKRETEEIGWCQSDGILCHDTHRITFDTIDGKPVCDSIRMDEIK